MVWGCVIGVAGEQPPPENAGPLTVAERSEYRATSRSHEVLQFVQELASQAPHMRAFEFGKTVEGRPMVATVVAQPPVVPDPAGQPLWDESAAGQSADRQPATDSRLVVLLLGNIHSGECAGKEALLMLLRELALGADNVEPDGWLQNLVVLFVPNYNADANDQISLDNRPGQVGPVEGMGRRENAQGLDLNRDFMKLDAPESRALVELIHRWDPHVFIDMHTTNGSRHRYALTYDIPHNLASPEDLRRFMRQEMMPTITELLDRRGIGTFYYGNFNRDHTRWVTFGDAPRYSTEYMGLRGRMAILSEAYAYISYEQRIVASREFVRECLDYLAPRAGPIRTMLDQIRTRTMSPAVDPSGQGLVTIRSQVTPLEQPVTVRGYDATALPDTDAASPPTPADPPPHDYEVAFWTRYEPLLNVTRPAAYLIPAEQHEVLQRLRIHGIAGTATAEDLQCQVQAYQVTAVRRAQRPYQGHAMLQIEVEPKAQMRHVPRGTILIPTRQPLSNLIVHLLEPQASDSLATWGLVQPEPVVGSEFPIQRLMELPPGLATD